MPEIEHYVQDVLAKAHRDLAEQMAEKDFVPAPGAEVRMRFEGDGVVFEVDCVRVGDVLNCGYYEDD